MRKHTHIFSESDKIGYVICSMCGTYKSVDFSSRESLYENNYWSWENGRSTIKEQVYNLTVPNDTGLSKVDMLLSKIGSPGRLLEIGVSPGILISIAKDMGHEVVGIEPDIKNVPEIKKVCGDDKRIEVGYFPECVDSTYGKFDYIIAADVLEHIEDYVHFVESVYHLLNAGGRFVFMSPINTPEVGVRDIDYISKEHIWIFSKRYLKRYLGSLFKSVSFDFWEQGHNVVVCDK